MFPEGRLVSDLGDTGEQLNLPNQCSISRTGRSSGQCRSGEDPERMEPSGPYSVL